MTVNKPIGAKDLPEDWKWLHLEDLCSRVSVGHVGETNSHFCGEEGVPFLRSQNIRPGNVVLEDVKYVTNEFHQKSKKSQLLHGDIAIVRVGQNRGDCAVIPPNLPEVNCANIVFARLSDIRYSEFIGAFFNTSLGRESLLAVSTGSAQGVLNTKSIAKVVVPVPPVEKAYEIGNVYKSFSDKLELNSQTNQTLEQMAQAIFKSWFVDFNPVKAKMNGEQPEGMDAATASLFPEKLVESELGLIPEGWDIGSIEDVTSKVFSGGTPATKNEDFWGGDLPWFSSGETRNNFIIGTEKYITEAGVRGSSTKASAYGDVLIASAGQGHTRGQTSFNSIDCYINQSVVALRAAGNVSAYWLYYNLERRYDEMRSVSDSHSSRGSLTTKLLKGMPAIIPSKEIVITFDRIVESLVRKQVANSNQNEDLSALRDTLLPKLLSGEIDLGVK
ncbi:restriction endonuclease subunit S [Vibrio cyclitrophicus]|uniref:restriction endonuclease subunit S n=1 Tax=Vibrio cyclitrophicus TaxID=47951 RepID=UPI00399AA394